MTRFLKQVHHNRILLLMMLPSIVFLLIFAYIPLGGIVLAFENYSDSLGIFHSQWVGLQNFEFFFITGDAARVTENTALYNIAFIVVNTVLQLGLAILLSELKGKWFKKSAQTIMFLPYFLSWVVIGAIGYNLFSYSSGTVNEILRMFHQSPVDIYNSPGPWRFIMVAFYAWQQVGWGTMLYFAAIVGIDKVMYEAADIDGANVFQRIWRITIPSVRPTMMILILLQVGHIFRGQFQMFWQLTGQSPTLFPTTDVIDTYVYRTLLQSQNIGVSAAMGVYQSVLCVITILIVNYLVGRVDKDYALF